MNLVFKMCNPNNTLEFKVAKDFLHVQMTGVGNERLLSDDEALDLRDYLNEQYPAWVSVEDRLPDEEGLYIVDVGCVISAYWQNNDWYDVSTETKDLPDIAHWRPLPNPPKGKNDE